MRISDWSSDVCSSDLRDIRGQHGRRHAGGDGAEPVAKPDAGDDGGALWCGGDDRRAGDRQIGRASCRERVCQYVSISVVAVSIKTNTMKTVQHKIRT